MNKLYLNSGYANMKLLFDDPCFFVAATGGRGTGKTYGACQQLLERKRRFIFLRRTQTESKIISTQETCIFKKVNKEITINSIQTNISGYYDGENLLGYQMALSTFANVRGVDFSDVDTIVYDEFIPEKHKATRIKEEYNALLNLYETVNRNRELQGQEPVKMILLSNSNDLANPIYIGLEIVDRVVKMCNKKIEHFSDNERGLSIYLFMRSPISDKKKQTALYRLNTQRSFTDMAIANMFKADREAVSSRNLREYTPLVNVSELFIYRHKSREEFYVSPKQNGTFTKTYKAVNDIEVQRFQEKFNYLYFNYLINDNVIFENSTMLVLFEKIFK